MSIKSQSNEMATPPCYVYPDTNVLLHFRSLDELPVSQMLGSRGEISIVLLTTVLDELDREKVKNSNTGIRKRAADVIGRLDRWSEAGKSLGNGAMLILRAERHSEDMQALRLSPDIQDDHVIAEVLTAQRENPGRHVLLTADIGLRTRAKARGIETISPRAEFGLPVPDRLEKELRETKAALERHTSRLPALSLAFDDGELTTRFQITCPRRLEETEVEAMLEREEKALVMPPRQRPSGGDVTSVLAAMAEDHLEPSVFEINGFNESVAKFIKEYGDYLRKHRFANDELEARTLLLGLRIANDGTSEARTVRVTVTAEPAGVIEFRRDPPKRVKQPAPPRRPQRRTSLFDDLYRTPTMPTFMPPTPRNVRGPFIEDGVVEYEVGTVLHKATYDLGRFYAVFPSVASIRPFTLRTAMLSSELGNWQSRDLHVVVEVSAPEEAESPNASVPEAEDPPKVET